MSSAKRYLLIALCFVLAVTTFTMLAPRAAHALVATLVQVVNTPTNAVPTVQAPAATQRYHSQCSENGYQQTYAQCDLQPVPAGQTLFVESVSLAGAAGDAESPDLYAGVFYTDEYGVNFQMPMLQQGSANMWVGNFAGRISIVATKTPSCGVFFRSSKNFAAVSCSVYGYLAPAQ